MIRVASCGIIWRRVRERLPRPLTSVTLNDILRYIRYIAEEAGTDVELPGYFFVYRLDIIQVVASGTTIVVGPITINVEKWCPRANPFDVWQIHFSSDESACSF
jgi:hypothetical protein